MSFQNKCTVIKVQSSCIMNLLLIFLQALINCLQHSVSLASSLCVYCVGADLYGCLQTTVHCCHLVFHIFMHSNQCKCNTEYKHTVEQTRLVLTSRDGPFMQKLLPNLTVLQRWPPTTTTCQFTRGLHYKASSVYPGSLRCLDSLTLTLVVRIICHTGLVINQQKAGKQYPQHHLSGNDKCIYLNVISPNKYKELPQGTHCH